MLSDRMQLKIWYISKYASLPYASKVGARGFLLLREFARLGHYVALITSDSNHLASPPNLSSPRLSEVVDGVEIHWLRTWKYKTARSIGRMISWIDFEWQLLRMPKSSLARPDAIIVSSPSLLTIVNGLILCRRYRCKFVFEVRDIWPLMLSESGKISPWNPFVMFLGWIERLAYEAADLIVGTMPNLAEHVRQVAVKQKPVVCVPQGIDPSLLNSGASVSVEYVANYIPSDRFIVCHAGSIGADNALGTLIETARKMQDRVDVHFLIVGEGYLKKDLQRSSEGLNNVSFAPAVPREMVQSILQHADLLYLATHNSPMLRFGQSLNKLIDYMLSGKPIIASYSGFPSMINEAKCGSIVPAENVARLRGEIERYVNMPIEERILIGERGRRWLLANRKFKKLAADYLRHLAVTINR